MREHQNIDNYNVISAVAVAVAVALWLRLRLALWCVEAPRRFPSKACIPCMLLPHPHPHPHPHLQLRLVIFFFVFSFFLHEIKLVKVLDEVHEAEF